MSSPDPFDAFMTEYRDVLHQAGVWRAALEEAEEKRRLAFSNAVVTADISSDSKMPANKAEHWARTSDGYKAAVDALDAARAAYEAANAQAVWFTARFEAWRTRSASKRAEFQSGAKPHASP